MSDDLDILSRPDPPSFDNVNDDRRRQKEVLSAACRLFALFGLENGTAGHAAVRDPAEPSRYWTNPFGKSLRTMKASDLILVDDKGDLVEGEGVVNLAAFAIHSQVHRARPDVNGSIHLHGTSGMAWSSLGRLLDPIVQDSCAFYEDHVLYPDFAGPVVDLQEGEKIAKSLGNAKAMILQHHGLLTVGETLDEAAWWMLRLERCCQVHLLAEAAGTPHLIDPETARATAMVVGTNKAGWFSFQGLLERIGSEQPEFRE